jgi:hypothetical protein
MENRLSLLPAAIHISGKAIALYLSDMSPYRFPPSDLSLIIFVPPSHVVTTVPLKPTAWIVRIYPTLPSPNRQRLTGINAEEVQFWIVSF